MYTKTEEASKLSLSAQKTLIQSLDDTTKVITIKRADASVCRVTLLCEFGYV